MSLPPNRLQLYLADTDVRAVYDNVRRHRIIISGYDVTRRCNLRCEGCFFFEGDRADGYADDVDLEAYRRFFRAERERGITYPHLAGAEPALVQDRLRAAAESFDQGLVYTNGTLPIDPDLPFMLHISVWGNRETDRKYRGADVLGKALELYGGDDRAIFMYTMNHGNIDHLPEIVRMVHDAGSRISFSHYSPTRLYNRKLAGTDERRTRTFRISTAQDNLCLNDLDLDRARRVSDEMMAGFPDTVVYSPYYNETVSAPGPLFAIDAQTGMATDCPILNKPYHRQYHTDLSWDDSECCIPNVDCRSCRHYVSVYSLVMDRMRDHLASRQSFVRWLDVVDTWLALHVRGYRRSRILLREAA
jgi:MoaA/NifB/PqqE/SkfB family radical SAM enzyme